MAASGRNSPNREQRRETMSRCSVAMSADVDDPVGVAAVVVYWLQVTWRSLREAKLSTTTVYVCMQLRKEAPPSLEELRSHSLEGVPTSHEDCVVVVFKMSVSKVQVFEQMRLKSAR